MQFSSSSSSASLSAHAISCNYQQSQSMKNYQQKDHPYSAKHGITRLFFLLFLLSVLPFSSAQAPPDVQDPYGNMRFSPSMAIIIVVLISALFFMGFFSIYIRHCNDSSGSSVQPVAGGQRNRNAVARGLDPEVIETFPTFVYSEVKQLKIGKGALECAVCLNEFENDETLRLIPKCDHVFHPECIDAWLESHTTCPVCRANLVPQPGESVPPVGEPHTELDLEAQNDVAQSEPQQDVGGNEETQPPEPQVINVSIAKQTLNRNRTRRSRSSRPRKFPRSHSTGHSLVQPGENTERFTLRLPVDVRKQIMNRELNRSNSLLVLPRESSSRSGYRTGAGEGSSRGRTSKWLERFNSFKSERWVFSVAPPFFSRGSSLRSPRVAATTNVIETAVQPTTSPSESNRLVQPVASSSEPNRPPV